MTMPRSSATIGQSQQIHKRQRLGSTGREPGLNSSAASMIFSFYCSRGNHQVRRDRLFKPAASCFQRQRSIDSVDIDAIAAQQIPCPVAVASNPLCKNRFAGAGARFELPLQTGETFLVDAIRPIDARAR